VQALVVGEQLRDGAVGRRDVGGITRQGRPPERALALAEQRSHERRHEPRVGVRAVVREAAELGAGPQVVAVVERDGAALLERDDRVHVRAIERCAAATYASGSCSRRRAASSSETPAGT
jgi:hypothetical protein